MGQEWLGSATGMAGNRRGFCRSLLLGVNGGSFGRRRCSFCWLHETNDGARGGRSRAAWLPLTCPSRGSSTFEVFFPLSSSLGGVSSLLLLCIFFSSGVGQLSASSKTSTQLRYKELCRPPVRASRGQGEPHDAS